MCDWYSPWPSAGLYSAKGILIAATGILNPDPFLVTGTQELSTAIAANSFGKPLPLTVSTVITLLFTVSAAFPAARYASPRIPGCGNGLAGPLKSDGASESIKRIWSFESYCARLNLRRNPGRTSITILSLIMSIVFVALQSFRGLLDTSRKVQEIHLGDYAVTSESDGFPPSSVEEMKSQKLLKSLFTTKLKLYAPDKSGQLPIQTSLRLNPGETLQVAGLDDDRLTGSLSNLTEQDVSDLLSGTACLIKIRFLFHLRDRQRNSQSCMQEISSLSPEKTSR